MSNYLSPIAEEDENVATPYACNAAIVGVAAIAIVALNAAIAVNYIVLGNIAGLATIYYSSTAINQVNVSS